jgi:hypothetical protein
MPLTSDIKPWGIKPLPGMNSKIEDLELNDKFVEVAQNCRFDGQPGSVDKRLPTTYYNSASLGTGGILGLYRYYSKGGTIKSVTVHDTTAYVGDDSAGTFSAIRTNLTTGKRTSFLTYKDIIIASNGYDNMWCYDGSSDNVTWELGACKATLSANTGTVLEDCEDAWNEQVIANVTAATDTGYVGTNCAKFTITDTFTTGIIGSEVVSATDLHASSYIHMWIKSSESLANTVLKFCVDEHGSLASSRDFDVGALTADTWTRVSIDTTAITETAIISIGFKMNADQNKNIILYVDDVRWSKLGHGAYYYSVTMDADAYICGAVSNTVTTTASYTQVSLTNIPIGPIGTTNRKIFRTAVGGSELKLVATISDNETTTYTDNIDDAHLGATMGAVTDDMPKGSTLQLHRERLFVTGDPNYPNRIYYANPYLPWYIQQTTNLDYMEIDADDGDTIMGIPIQLGVMLCLKKRTLRKLYITSATSGADPATWYAEDPIAFTGTPAQWSVVQTQHGVVFLGWDHWKRFNGSAVEDIIDEFDTNDVLPGLYNQVFSYWLQDDILLAGYSDSTVATKSNNRLMRFDFKRNTLSYDTIAANCISANVGDNETGDVLIGDSVNGYVYKAERSDIYYKLLTKTQANAGTENTTFVGGTEASPTIQIGSTTTAAAIVSDVCVLWDDPTTSPGSNWTEITTLNDKFILINTAAVGTTGTVTVSDTTESTVNYLKFRIFKHSAGTDYEFPVGSIVMYGTDGTPEGWVDYSTDGYYIQLNATPGSGSMQLPILAGDGGTNLDQTIALRFIKKVGESAAWDGIANYAYALYYSAVDPAANEFTDVTSTYTGKYLKSGTSLLATTGDDSTGSTDPIQSSSTNHTYSSGNTGVGENTIDGDVATYYSHVGGDYATGSGGSFGSTVTVISQHDFSAARTISSVTYRAYVYSQSNSSTDNAHYAYIYVEYNVGGVWTAFTGGTVSGGAATDGNTTIGSASASTTITQTVTDVIGIRIRVSNSGSFHNSDGNHTWDCRIYELASVSQAASYVTFRLVSKILGKMKDYNSAIAANTQYGTWISPGIQVSAETLGSMYWNEDKLSTDEINVYTRTGATQSSVEDGTAITTVDHTTEKFTLIGHGLSNTNRITIDATVMPAGLVKTRVYYVVGVSGADFQVSYTSGGAVVTFTSNGTAVTFKKWSSTVLSDPNGSAIGSTAAEWIQYLVAFICADSTADNPTVYFTGGYAIQFNYARGVSYAESSVEFIYRTGYRHFDDAFADKIFKKILVYHTGDTGNMLVKWNTENASGSLTCDLSSYGSRFESFFPDTAFGRKLNLEIYKNDLYDLKVKEINGLYTPEPIII